MRVYSCVVNCGGNVLNQVRKPEVTAAEIILLQSIHGEDAVTDIMPIRMDKRSHAAERDRLGGIYGDDKVGRTFGPSFNPLPVKLADDNARVRKIMTPEKKPEAFDSDTLDDVTDEDMDGDGEADQDE